MKTVVEALFEAYPRFKDCTIQTFDDNKERKDKTLARLFENKEANYKTLEELNLKGAGIFFSVNPMIAGKRDKESVVWVSSWICEIDWLDKDLQKKLIDNCPLKPNMIIESNSSYHLYWFAKDGTKENWNKVCNGLRNYFDGDPAVVDISRVLRLPWYNHMKDQTNPFLIDLVEFVPWGYTEDQMLAAYQNTQSLSEIKQSMLVKETKARDDLGGDYYWDRVKNMDTKTMLSEISGSSWVSGETIEFSKNHNGTEQIVVNGKSTGAWIDKNWKIGSSAGGWPNRTNWVFWYGICDGKEMARWINEKHPEMVIKKTVPKKETKEAIVEDMDVDWTAITPFSRWLPSIDAKFGRFERNRFIVTIGESQSWKTEFTFFQARVNADRGYKVCYIALEMSKKNMILRIAQKTAGVSKTEWDDKKFSESQKMKMKAKYDQLNNYNNLDITYLSKPTLEEVVEVIKERQRQGYELFYIDNLGFIKDPDIEEIEYVPIIVRELKDMTNTQPISINLLHHFNKWGTKDRVWPRGMASIRSSGKIENDADYVFQVWRDLDNDIPAEDKKLVGLYLQKDRIRWDPSDCQVEFDRWDYKPYIKNKKEQPKIEDEPF